MVKIIKIRVGVTARVWVRVWVRWGFVSKLQLTLREYSSWILFVIIVLNLKWVFLCLTMGLFSDLSMSMMQYQFNSSIIWILNRWSQFSRYFVILGLPSNVCHYIKSFIKFNRYNLRNRVMKFQTDPLVFSI